MSKQVTANVDTLTIQFKVNPLEKEKFFRNFCDGKVKGIRKKWKQKKMKKPKISMQQLKGKYLYFPPYYDKNYFKPYPFTGGNNGYSINYCHYKYRDDYVLVTFQHKNVVDKSYEEIYISALMFLDSMGINIGMLELKDNLNRIDFFRDYEFDSMDEFLAIINILSKSRISHNGVEKETFTNAIDNVEYVTGIRYNPQYGYTEVIVYYKYLEMNTRHRKHSHVGLNISLYDNVIRTELRLKNKRLYYNQKHTLKIDKTLANYSNNKVSDDCFRRYIQPIFYKEPFYRVDYALLAIQSDNRLTETEAEKLCKLVTDINQKGFTKAKQEYSYCDDTFEKHIKLLRSIGINPLTFDKEIDIAILHNFTTKEVCRDYTSEQWNYKKKTYDEWGLEISQ